MVRGKRNPPASGYVHSAGQRGGTSAARGGRGRGRGRGGGGRDSASPAPEPQMPSGSGSSAPLGASAPPAGPSTASAASTKGKAKAKGGDDDPIEVSSDDGTPKPKKSGSKSKGKATDDGMNFADLSSDEDGVLRPRTTQKPASKSKAKVVESSTDDEDAPKAPAKKKSGPKRKPGAGTTIAATKSAEVVYLNPDVAEDALILDDSHRCVTPSNIEACDHLKNWKRWSSVKDDLRLKNLVEPTKPSLLPPRIDSLIRSVPIQNWEIERVEFVAQNRLVLPKMTYPPRTGCWAVTFRDADAKNKQVNAKDRTALIYGSLVGEDEVDRAQGVADYILDFINRSPMPKVDLKPTNMLAQMIVITSLAMLDAARDQKPLPAISDYIIEEVIKQQGGFKLQWLNDKKRWEVAFQLFDRNMSVITGQRRILLNPKDISLVNQPPSLPDAVSRLIEDNHVPTWGNIDRDALSDQELAQHEACIGLGRHVQFVMFGACGDKNDLLTQASGIASIYRSQADMSNQTKTLANVYNDSKLFLTDGHVRSDSVTIRLTNPIKVDILNGVVPEIRVVGKAKDRVSVPLEVMTQAFLGGENVLNMWQIGCIKADSVNRMPPGTKLRNPCDHTDAERQISVHVCQMCEGIDFCQNMVYSKYTDLRVDRDCENKTDESCHTSKGAFVRNALNNVLTRGIGGEPSESKKARKARTDAFAKKHYDADADCWQDGLLKGTRSEFGEVSGTRSQPFKASVDAVVPFYVDADGKSWDHHEDACVATGQYDNLATNTWNKGSLRLAAQAKELKDENLDAYEALYNEFDHQMAIRTKYPHKRSSRRKIKMTSKKYQAALAEMVEGILEDETEEVPASIPTYSGKYVEFDDADQKRIMKLIRQLITDWEKKNGKSLPPALKKALLDGVPCPCWPGHKPTKWTWKKLAKFLAYHYDLLWWWCDRHFDVDETPESILLEIVKQWIERGGRGHLLFIPWTFLTLHAAGMAMGHVYHGRAMRTSYPLTGPKLTDAIGQRDDERCNMSIESRFENYLKSDYASKDYDAIVADLMEKVHRDRSNEWYKAPEKAVPKVNLNISTDGQAQRQRSRKFLSGTALLESAGNDGNELEEVDAADLVEDFEQTAADIAALLE